MQGLVDEGHSALWPPRTIALTPPKSGPLLERQCGSSSPGHNTEPLDLRECLDFCSYYIYIIYTLLTLEALQQHSEGKRPRA